MHSLRPALAHLIGFVAFFTAAAVCGSGPAAAQPVPIPVVQEALIKSTLLTFNDANVTGDYDVLHAKLSKPFRDKFPPDRLKEAFKAFADAHVDFKIIAAKTPIAKQEPTVNEKGVLSLYGHFDTTPSHVYYELEFIMSDGEWKPIKINVNVRKPESKPDSKPEAKPESKPGSKPGSN
jgi:hypothetical protein